MGEADAGTGQGDERAHAKLGMTLEKIKQEIKERKERVKKIEKTLEKKEKDLVRKYDTWEGTN